MTIAGISVLGLCLFAFGGYVLHRCRTDRVNNPDRALKLVVWMFFLGGFCVTGGVVNTLDNVFGKAGTTGGRLFAVSATAILTVAGIIFVFEIWSGAHPKTGKPERRHPYMAALTPILLGMGALKPVVVAISTALNGDVSAGLSHWMGS